MIGKIVILIFILFSPSLHASTFEESAAFPLRNIYKMTPVISHDELYEKLNDVIVIDVRSKYEYDTLRIRGAVHLSIAGVGFISELKRIRKTDQRLMVFYCNGITCKKSYQAGEKAIRNNISNISVFDLGIFAWAKTYPHEATLLGESPVPLEKLLTQEKLSQHTLSPAEFIQKINRNTIVVDIREPLQRDIVILRKVTRLAPSDRILRLILRAKEEQKTLLIYDAVGKQIQWLQYLLESEGLEDYYFMEEGIRGYIKADLPLTKYD
ncbi:hypothetical protein MHO82_07005 [Vibrio sp. Of7-15]|uniref:rhodanese-like domain-containing protein n=1 Tax=Vibrio sp. Of7-15 TaxID=2724879 RepID=UPI001EF2DFB8|nr:hypothetical protein [Vibrio sp. Of7-15]